MTSTRSRRTSRDAPRYASTVVSKLRDAARNLRKFPRSGRMVPELADERYREKIVYGWRMIYRFENAVVTIATIVHSRQSFDTGVGRITRT